MRNAGADRVSGAEGGGPVRAAEHRVRRRRRINEIVQGERGVTAGNALRLGKLFGMQAKFWMNPQSHYDLEVAKDAIAGKPDNEVEVLKAP